MEDLAHLKEVIQAALNRSQCRAAAYFGSIAKGTADKYSDADVIVCCDDEAAEQFIAMLHEALRVSLYRPFDDREPSGRYWFTELSPYTKLDVSFHKPAEYGDLLVEGGLYIEPPFQEIAITRCVQFPAVRSSAPLCAAEEISFSKLLYKYQAGTKHVLRGKPCKEDIEALDIELARAIRGRVSEPVARLYVDTKEIYHVG
jgi:predicted nucleotidyltransferase